MKNFRFKFYFLFLMLLVAIATSKTYAFPYHPVILEPTIHSVPTDSGNGDNLLQLDFKCYVNDEDVINNIKTIYEIRIGDKDTGALLTGGLIGGNSVAAVTSLDYTNWNISSITVDNFVPNQLYYYRVKVVNTAVPIEEIPYSSWWELIPNAGTAITPSIPPLDQIVSMATSPTTAEIKFKYTGDWTGLYKWKIQYSFEGGSWQNLTSQFKSTYDFTKTTDSELGDCSSSSTCFKYTHSNLIPEGTYTYRVALFSDTNEYQLGPYVTSGPASTTAIPQPNQLIPITTSPTTIDVKFKYTGSWTGLHGWKMEWSTDNINWNTVTSGDNSTNDFTTTTDPELNTCSSYYNCYKYTHSSLSPNTTYYYRIALLASPTEYPIKTYLTSDPITTTEMPQFDQIIPTTTGPTTVDVKFKYTGNWTGLREWNMEWSSDNTNWNTVTSENKYTHAFTTTTDSELGDCSSPYTCYKYTHSSLSPNTTYFYRVTFLADTNEDLAGPFIVSEPASTMTGPQLNQIIPLVISPTTVDVKFKYTGNWTGLYKWQIEWSPDNINWNIVTNGDKSTYNFIETTDSELDNCSSPYTCYKYTHSNRSPDTTYFYRVTLLADTIKYPPGPYTAANLVTTMATPPPNQIESITTSPTTVDVKFKYTGSWAGLYGWQMEWSPDNINWNNLATLDKYAYAFTTTTDSELNDCSSSYTCYKYTHSDLSPNTTYFYRVILLTDTSEYIPGPYTTSSPVTTMTKPHPDKVIPIVTSPTTVNVKFKYTGSWAELYRWQMEWSTDNINWNTVTNGTNSTYDFTAATDSELGNCSSSNTCYKYTHSNLSPNTTYYYRVAFLSSATGHPPGPYTMSELITTTATPSPNQIISLATSPTTVDIKFKYTESWEGLHGWKMEWSTDNINWNTVTSGTTSTHDFNTIVDSNLGDCSSAYTCYKYTHSNLSPNTTYYHRISLLANTSEYPSGPHVTSKPARTTAIPQLDQISTIATGPATVDVKFKYTESWTGLYGWKMEWSTDSINWNTATSGDQYAYDFTAAADSELGNCSSSYTCYKYTHSSLSPNTTYFYRVTLLADTDTSEYMPGPHIISKPANTTAIPQSNQITPIAITPSTVDVKFKYTGSWTGLYGWQMEWSTDNINWNTVTNGDKYAYNFIETTDFELGDCSSTYSCYKYTHSNRYPGTTYFYRVALLADTSEYPPGPYAISDPVTTVIEPQLDKITPITTNPSTVDVKFKYTGSWTGLYGWQMEWSTDNLNWNAITSLDKSSYDFTTTTDPDLGTCSSSYTCYKYTHSGLSPNTTYYYRIVLLSDSSKYPSGPYTTSDYVTTTTIPQLDQISTITTDPATIDVKFKYTGSWTGLYGWQMEWSTDNTNWNTVINGNQYAYDFTATTDLDLGDCSSSYTCYKYTHSNLSTDTTYFYRIALLSDTSEYPLGPYITSNSSLMKNNR